MCIHRRRKTNTYSAICKFFSMPCALGNVMILVLRLHQYWFDVLFSLCQNVIKILLFISKISFEALVVSEF